MGILVFPFTCYFYKISCFYFQIVIVDVLDKDHCVCKTDEGKVLEGMATSYLYITIITI